MSTTATIIKSSVSRRDCAWVGRKTSYNMYFQTFHTNIKYYYVIDIALNQEKYSLILKINKTENNTSP